MRGPDIQRETLFSTVIPEERVEKLLRAQLLMAFYTIRSERQLMEQIDYNLLSRAEEAELLYKKSKGTAAKLSYMGHVLIENRSGLIVQAAGAAEREVFVGHRRTHPRVTEPARRSASALMSTLAG